MGVKSCAYVNNDVITPQLQLVVGQVQIVN